MPLSCSSTLSRSLSSNHLPSWTQRQPTFHSCIRHQAGAKDVICGRSACLSTTVQRHLRQLQDTRANQIIDLLHVTWSVTADIHRPWKELYMANTTYVFAPSPPSIPCSSVRCLHAPWKPRPQSILRIDTNLLLISRLPKALACNDAVPAAADARI